MKRTRKYWIGGGVLLGLALVFVFYPKGEKESWKLVTEKVRRGSLSTTVTATGTVEPITLVEIGTQVSGVISKIYVDYNSEVKAGQVIAELDKRMLESELRTTEANLKLKEVEWLQQQRNYNRNKELWEKQAISKADWEEVQTAYESAQLGVTSLQASLFKAKINLGYATIYSTIDGVVISRAVEEGQTVAASFSTPTLFTIANDLTKMRVIANVDEADIGQVKEGQRVMFKVDAYIDEEFNGTVVQVRLSATTTANVVTYEVVIDAPNPTLKLKPGLTASVNIYTLEEKDVPVISVKALRFSPNPEIIKQLKNIEIQPLSDLPEGKVVWVLDNNRLIPKSISIGTGDGVSVQVTGGLSDGEEIVSGVSQQNMMPMPAANGEASPFMPARPGGNNKKR